jgi:hypothetical protein
MYKCKPIDSGGSSNSVRQILPGTDQHGFLLTGEILNAIDECMNMYEPINEYNLTKMWAPKKQIS